MRVDTYIPTEILETIPVRHYEVGKRIQLKLQYVSCTKNHGTTQFVKFGGNTLIYKLKFRDEMGRLYLWETSSATEYNFDKNWFLLIGKVIGFTACNGEYLTLLKSCKYTKF